MTFKCSRSAFQRDCHVSVNGKVFLLHSFYLGTFFKTLLLKSAKEHVEEMGFFNLRLGLRKTRKECLFLTL